MARTAERKISIARRIRDLAVDKYGLRDEDLMFDPLVLPVSTGIEEDRRNAMETIEGTRRISQELPNCHTVVGLSNVSFGLKQAARVVIEQRVPARAARGRPDRRDRPCLQDPAAQPHPRRAVERGPGPDLRPSARGFRPADAFHFAVSRQGPNRSRQRRKTSLCRSRRSSKSTSSTARNATWRSISTRRC